MLWKKKKKKYIYIYIYIIISNKGMEKQRVFKGESARKGIAMTPKKNFKLKVMKAIQ